MAKFPSYSNRIGMNAALDIVEDALKSLKEKALQQRQKPELKNAETNTFFHTGCSIQTSNTNLLTGNETFCIWECSYGGSLFLATMRVIVRLLRTRGHNLASSTEAHGAEDKRSPRPRKGHQKEPNQQQQETSVLINRRPNIDSGKSRSYHERHRGNQAAKAKKKKKCIPGPHASQHSRKSQQQPCSNFPSSHDVSHESSRFDHSFGAINSQHRGDIPAHSGSNSSQRDIPAHSGSNSSHKRVNRERHSKSSPDESLQRRKYESQVKLPQCSRQSHQRSKEKGVHLNCKTTKPVSAQSYAQPTLTSKFRDEISSRKKEEKEKENIVTFISCGSKSKSYHVGVIAQQGLSHLKNMTSKELEYITVPRTCNQESKADETGSESESVTEQTVKRAMANIQLHIALATKHISKN